MEAQSVCILTQQPHITDIQDTSCQQALEYSPADMQEI